MQGVIFAIEEFAVYDGPGIRVNVLFKGCPMQCRWCHNPEGFKKALQVIRNLNGCTGCGACRRFCGNPIYGNEEYCSLCERCIINCPHNLIRICGEIWEADDLSSKLMEYRPYFESSGGGVTFSGGEVLTQPEFLLEMLRKTKSLHRIIETSGYGVADDFKAVLEIVDFVYYDIKIMNRDKHIYYTGVDNDLILQNAKALMDSSVPFVVRVPFIHEVNTDEENLIHLAEFLFDTKSNFQGIELLNYNELAGAKYHMMGATYQEIFSQASKEEIERGKNILSNLGVLVRSTS